MHKRYPVYLAHRLGIHRFCRRTFSPQPDLFGPHRPDCDADVRWLSGGRPPLEEHS